MKAKQIIEEHLDVGADADEVVEALRDAGWHLVHGPVFSQWNDTEGHTIFAEVATVDETALQRKRVFSERSAAHMGAASIAAVRDDLTTKIAESLVETLKGKVK